MPARSRRVRVPMPTTAHAPAAAAATSGGSGPASSASSPSASPHVTPPGAGADDLALRDGDEADNDSEIEILFTPLDQRDRSFTLSEVDHESFRDARSNAGEDGSAQSDMSHNGLDRDSQSEQEGVSADERDSQHSFESSSKSRRMPSPQGGRRRSLSMPPVGLRASSPTNSSDRPQSDNGHKKNVRFSYSIESIMRRAPTRPRNPRSRSAPANPHHLHMSGSFGSLVNQVSDQRREHTVRRWLTDEISSAALEMFENTVDEYLQLVEEFNEASETYRDIDSGHEDVTMSPGDRKSLPRPIVSRGDSMDTSMIVAVDDDSEYQSGYDPQVGERTSIGDRDTYLGGGQDQPHSRRRSSTADEDIDESCDQQLVGNTDSLTSNPDGSRSAGQDPEWVSLFGKEARVIVEKGYPKAVGLSIISEDPSSSVETVQHTQRRPTAIPMKRRVTDGFTVLRRSGDTADPGRRASMPDATTLTGHIGAPGLISKASPASCAITACSVRAVESPRMSTVHPSSRASDRSTTMSQIVRSDSGIFEALWEDQPLPAAHGDIASPSSRATGPSQGSGKARTVLPEPTPMDKVKTKLAAWSWARDQTSEDDEGRPRWKPLLPCEKDVFTASSPPLEQPRAPPNSNHPSATSSARNSVPQSPYAESTSDAEDEADSPIELRVPTPPLRSNSTRTVTAEDLSSRPKKRSTYPAPSSDARPIVAHEPRHLLSLTSPDCRTHRESRFGALRDSVEVLKAHRQTHDAEVQVNQQLMNSRDSFILTRSKFETRHGRPPPFTSADRLPVGHAIEARPAWSRMGGLSPILDASPPGVALGGIERLRQAQAEEARTKAKAKAVVTAHQEEHVSCPICEVERPVWFARNCRNGSFT